MPARRASPVPEAWGDPYERDSVLATYTGGAPLSVGELTLVEKLRPSLLRRAGEEMVLGADDGDELWRLLEDLDRIEPRRQFEVQSNKPVAAPAYYYVRSRVFIDHV